MVVELFFDPKVTSSENRLRGNEKDMSKPFVTFEDLFCQVVPPFSVLSSVPFLPNTHPCCGEKKRTVVRSSATPIFLVVLE